ncbi:MAG: YbaK/EbsC family protein [Anaerolineales bacterium]|nr:YbaK/EbsC family protein [Anaerolineales bacterium]
MVNSLTPDDLEMYLIKNQIQAEVIRLDAPTPTVETAAEVAGVSPDQIVKSLLFLIEAHPVLVIASGLSPIDRRLLAQHFGTNRRKTHFADPHTVLALTGFPVGAVPPVGHRTKLDVIVDPSVVEHPVVYGGGGSDSALLRIAPQLILEHNRAEVVPLQKSTRE